MEQIKVFYVNKGHLLTFEIGTLQLFKNVRSQVCEEIGIDPKDQLWMLLDGTAIDNQKMLSDYPGHGKDKSPFIIYHIRNKNNMSDMMFKGDLKEISDTVESAMDKIKRIQSNSNTNDLYTDLPNAVLNCCGKTAMLVNEWCTQLINEHNLLTSSWQCIFGSVEESLSLTQKKYKIFKKKFDELDGKIEEVVNLQENYADCLQLLKKINLPAQLLAHSRSQKLDQSPKSTNLYEWLDNSDPNNSIDNLVDQLLEQYELIKKTNDKAVLESINYVEDQTRNKDLREISGITRRMQTLKQNQAKVTELFDRIKHTIQIMTMASPPITDTYMIQNKVDDYMRMSDKIMEDLRKMKEYCVTFRKSKEELLANINARIHGWVVMACDRMDKSFREMVYFHERRYELSRKTELVQKIEAAPEVFAQSVSEVSRRSLFRKHFVTWQKAYMKFSEMLLKQEKEKRNNFKEIIENHFLKVLFRGLEDPMPEFFNKNIPSFDMSIPPLDEIYVDKITTACPELTITMDIDSQDIVRKLMLQAQCLNVSAISHDSPESSNTPTSCIQSSKDNFDSISGYTNSANRLSLSERKSSEDSPPLIDQETQSSVFYPDSLFNEYKYIISDVQSIKKQLSLLRTDFEETITETSTNFANMDNMVKEHKAREEREKTKEKIIEPDADDKMDNVVEHQGKEIVDLKKLLDNQAIMIEMLKTELGKDRSDTEESTIMFKSSIENGNMANSVSFFAEKLDKGISTDRNDQAIDASVYGKAENGDKFTQTRLNLKSMEMMISLHDISEGATVLIVYDERYQAFLLFSSSPYLHFVKESSLRRMNLLSPTGPVRTWFLGKVNSLDLCVIRKTNNRYNLELNTRVYRVDVSSVLLDVRGINVKTD
ncbi:unnamed protein product [Auanema sp. JU1783]|nr:unnamed protein product [Auanema sp. JU1783]